MTNLVSESDHLFFTDNGKYLIFTRQDEINIWDFTAPYPKLILDGNLIGLSSQNNIILTQSGKEVRGHELPSGNDVDINPNQFEDYQRVIVSGKSPNLLLVQDVLDSRISKTLKTKDNLTGADLNPLPIPNSPILIAKTWWDSSGFEGESLDCFNIQTGNMLFTTHSTYDTKYRYSLSGDRKTLAIKDLDNIRVFNVETGNPPTGNPLYEIRGNQIQFDDNNNINKGPSYKYYDFALHPTKKDKIAILLEDEIRITRLTQITNKFIIGERYNLPGEQLSSHKLEQPAERIIFSPDGGQIACIRTDKYWGCVLIVWELENNPI